MGLDMYLSKKTYVKNWDYMKPEELHEITVKKGGVPVSSIKPERISYIIEQVAYWRKANHIHRWFVENVQGGVDDCRDAYLEADTLQELLEVVSKVLDDHELASELLPVQAGFFFGGTDYDAFYFDDLAETKKMLEGILAEEGAEGSAYYYHSSW
jgi:hypothetical protein